MSASAPRNNLSDHVVLPKATNASLSLHPPQPKAAKFKPATSNSIPSSISLQRQTSTTLPSFSTPGFGKSKAAPSHSSSRFRDPINISSDSSSPGIKRSSSDTYISPDQPPAKRLKSEKENLLQPEPRPRTTDKGKGKAKAVLPPDDDDEPWHKMESFESNPFTMLDRDHPEYRLPLLPTAHSTPARLNNHANPPAPIAHTAPETKYPDLLSKSTGDLNKMLISNLELVCKFHAGELTLHDDAYTSEAIKSLLTDRITGIKHLLAHREKGAQGVPPGEPIATAPSVPPTRQQTPSYADIRRPTSPPPVTVTTRSYEATSYASTSTSVVREGSVVSTRDSTFVSVRERNETFDPPDDDEALWADLPDVTMDYLDDAVPSEAPVPPQVPLEDLTGPHVTEIKHHLARTFDLRSFRKNQYEAISAAMEGRDVFVLMPTGGGKSLCFQLPAVCQGGQTKGVTVVVSPLMALMTDQVDGLKAKRIDAVYLNSDTSGEELRHIQDCLYSSHSKPSLLYVTPERLKLSGTLKNVLGHLYRSGQLARFVIDEAHCISTWGQDFREAYQELHTLRDDYPEVPIMALTATADRKTIDDILVRLKLRDPAVFEQSFNRTNLFYSVVPKRSVEEMVSFIKSTHPNKTGIIYRNGRDSCEKLAQQLRQKGLNAKHFHGKMGKEEKKEVLNEWKSGKCHIIVATIAFGMGIDKAEVRFVIHFDLPKSMDGYYQETGRAGRDEKPADCILYYSFRDLQTILKLIRNDKDGTSTPASIERQDQAAWAVIRYCENESVCRRTQVLQHFGEKFDKKDCHARCNNCVNASSMVTGDFTEEAKQVLELVQSLQRGQENVTVDHCRNVFKGANIAAVRDKGHDRHPSFGAGKDIPREVLELLFNKLLYLDALIEQSVQTNAKWHTQYVKLGSKAKDFLAGRQTLQLSYRPKTPKPGGKAKAKSSRKPARAPPSKDAEQQLEPARALYADDDDIEWSPKKNARKPVAAEVVEVISDSEGEAPSRRVPPFRPDPETLHQKLVAHRQVILDADPSLTKVDVLDDETLELMSVVPPQDFVAFKQSLLDVATDKLGNVEMAKKYAEERYKKYGGGFLHVCQGTSADSNPTWRDKYAHRPASASTPKSVRKFNFKKGGL
ncbi:DNA helicase [Mycena alexandri]|uniref:DNA 3'-5' helicase n=1 Tax=Mycena alexandri TaxID=1745969 RepID=A0AAD6TDJ9_9AGAR|nr:DNA helicase [Mycena alexandri]